MGIFDIFSSPSYETFEKKGDGFFNANNFGLAKLEYEKALSRLENKTTPIPSCHQKRIANKLDESREALALQHKSNADNLIEAGCENDAVELLQLALELTNNPDLTRQFENLLLAIQEQAIGPAYDIEPDFEAVEGTGGQYSEEEYFVALCSTLPEDAQDAYFRYGDSFKTGYIALNQGDFERAAELLSKSLDEHGPTVSYIHLELATAHLNLGDMETARILLERFIENYPLSIRAYEMLCDIFWEKHAYSLALEFLRACPDDLKTSVPIILLVGETLFQAEKYPEAESFYLEYIRISGWNEYIAKPLARTYEALGSAEKAREVYGEIITACRGCGSKVDLFVKQRYADLSFEAGDVSENVLELYLSLCREDPGNRVRYYRRLSEIYLRHGHPEEAKRYLKFAEKVVRYQK